MLVLSRAGMLAIRAVGAPGAQGALVTGVQGCGVRTPNAAVVAAATAGLARELHIPKGAILIMGLLSVMFAAGLFSTNNLLSGSTESVDGAAPKVHCKVAPITTC